MFDRTYILYNLGLFIEREYRPYALKVFMLLEKFFIINRQLRTFYIIELIDELKFKKFMKKATSISIWAHISAHSCYRFTV
jgi:hypothetical protein